MHLYAEMFRKITWIDFPVVPDTISIDNVLEARRELVGLVEGGRSLFGLHPVENGWYCGATSLL